MVQIFLLKIFSIQFSVCFTETNNIDCKVVELVSCASEIEWKMAFHSLFVHCTLKPLE